MPHKKHKNIPVFIPHVGCPNNCVFCNQHVISGHCGFDETSVEREIADAVATLGENDEAEIAFFGGSFTGIDRDLMRRLLEISDRYLASGKVGAVRCSTRPDYIDDEVLSILGEHGVKTVELGLQSFSDEVLAASNRGHNAEVSRAACRLVKERGFALVGQMMVGLPRSNVERETETARTVVELGCDGARVYPTVVFRGTELAFMAERGEYEPLTLEGALDRTAAVLDVFDRASLPVIRVGLCASEGLTSDDTVAAGPNHPALGELAMSELLFRRVCEAIDASSFVGERIDVAVSRGALSRAIGQHGSNRKRIVARYSASRGIRAVRFVECDGLATYETKIIAD